MMGSVTGSGATTHRLRHWSKREESLETKLQQVYNLGMMLRSPNSGCIAGKAWATVSLKGAVLSVVAFIEILGWGSPVGN